MEVRNMPSQEVADAFHLMWDNFPDPVSLVHRSREVIAVSKAHENYLEPGVICARTGCDGPHTACLANEALKSGKTIVCPNHSKTEDKERLTYWIPLDGYPDYFVHFSIRFRIESDNSTITMSPMTDEHKRVMGVRWDDKKTGQ
ncbi:MAG: hypothetical protein LBI74_10890 [Synergistaceae bacterium]|jgi:hypothetical protein|nr:hypothetical protein [Synergistaceae bacterium]